MVNTEEALMITCNETLETSAKNLGGGGDLGNLWYFWVPEVLLVILLYTWCYFWVHNDTFGYLMVLLGT